MTLISNNEYQQWVKSLKEQVVVSQLQASVAVNEELIKLYWSIGQSIIEQQSKQGWGNGVINQLATDLKTSFPNMKGFSPRNLRSMKQLVLAWSEDSKWRQLVAKLPWGHNLYLLQKLTSIEERAWYAAKAIEHGWSRNVLAMQIDTKLIHREGNATTNFEMTLPKPTSDLANDTLKDPYCFDFLSIDSESREREIENALVKHITQFLLELGKGFALVGKQYRLEVGGEEFFADLLFFHLELNCYVVIELKATDFKPEHLGQLNFYQAAIDGEVKKPEHAPTIGLLLCRNKNRVIAEYAVRNQNSPIGIAEYKLEEMLPSELESQLPTIEDIEASLSIGLKGEQGDD